MRGYLRNLIIVFFVLFFNNLYCQSYQKEVLVAGKVINSKTGESVPLAHIILNGKRKVAVCDDWGLYRIRLCPGDSIKVTALGYKATSFVLADTINNDTHNDIKLEPTSYKLEEVTVYNLGTWEQFRQDFLNMKIDPSEKEKVVARMNKCIALDVAKSIGGDLSNQKYLARTNSQVGVVSTVGFSTGIGFGNRKESLSKYKIKSLKAEYKYSKILASKYNREIVSEITGEINKDRLDMLMAYINENGDFNYQTKQIEILATVKRLYTKFLISNPLKKSKFEQDTV